MFGEHVVSDDKLKCMPSSIASRDELECTVGSFPRDFEESSRCSPR